MTLLPENTRVDWNSFSEMDDDDLLPFLNEAYKELRIGSQLAKSIVSVAAVQQISSLVSKENTELAKVAADVVTCSWELLEDSDQDFLTNRFLHDFISDTNEMKFLKLDLAKTRSNQISKKFLLNAIRDTDAGLKALEILKSKTFSNEYTIEDLEELYRQTKDDMIKLRIIELAGTQIETQSWGSSKLLSLIENTKSDPLLLVNIFELLYNLNVTVLHDSIEVLKDLRHDPIIEMIPQVNSGLVKIFTKYYAKTEIPLPEWFLNLLFNELFDLSFRLNSIEFILKNRSKCEAVFREKTTLKDIIRENYSRTFVDIAVAELLTTILKTINVEHYFDYWFPESAAKHYFIMTLDPELHRRELGLSVICETAKFEKSIAYYQKIEDFPSLLSGPGCSNLRIDVARKLASHAAFQVAFGEITCKQWLTAKIEAIEIYEPNVETMEL